MILKKLGAFLLELLKREPVAGYGSLAVLANAIVPSLVGAGLINLSGNQVAAVVGVVGSLSTLIGAFIARGKVSPVDNSQG